MFSLNDLLGQQQGQSTLDELSNSIGASPSLTNSAIQMALPVILNGLVNNTSTPQGAQSLNNALQNHSGGLLDMLGSFIGGSAPQTPETDGTGILNHVLGGNQTQVAETISNESGLNVGQVAKLLITLAPIVMAVLGRQKRENNLDAGGVTDLLNGVQQQQVASGNPMMDMASRMLDRDGDGSAMDDLASIAASYFLK
ncbi:MAG: DUF937 domain-containing protein [Pyrinomonadaceae bacterium]